MSADEITGIREANYLPLGSVIRMRDGGIYQRDARGWRDFDGHYWYTPSWDYPARVLHRGGSNA